LVVRVCAEFGRAKQIEPGAITISIALGEKLPVRVMTHAEVVQARGAPGT
jgi:hypothetical protein